MDSNIATLVIGLAGIIATLISSGLGIYYTAKARSAPLRELLYSKQVELISKLIHKQGRFRIYTSVLGGDDPTFKERARNDIRSCLTEYSELTEEGAAILPTDLYVEVKRLSSTMNDLLGGYDEDGSIDESKFIELTAIEVKVALISRAVLGVDELTDESLKLFSSTKEFARLAELKSSTFEEIVRKKNA